MSDLHLSFAMTPYDRVLPLITGEVKPAGITLDYQGMPGAVPGVFYDQLKFQRYDVSEMSFSSFLVERAKGWPYRLLPVFHNRNFFYTNIVIRKSSGIRQDHPEDLKGKRFAVGDYQQSAALWIRGVLQHEFGITPQDMEWVQTRGEHYSHTGASGTKPPVKLTFANAAESDALPERRDRRGDELGAWARVAPSARQGDDIRGNPDFCTLFSDPKAEAIRYFKKNGHLPAAPHDGDAREHPGQASLGGDEPVQRLRGGEEARDARARDSRRCSSSRTTTWRKCVNMGADPFAYGVKANAAAIDMVQTISVEQSLSPRKQPLDEIFPEELLIAEERL